ncbi:MAG: hypothetical protein OEV28_14305 [Nitrospirota bacterium]|nr:hypothetical protein [Nitrospirota bacterium]
MTFRDDVKAASVDMIEALGEPVTYTSVIDGVKNINVVFDESAVDFNPYTGEVSAPHTEAMVVTIDAPNARHKDTILIDGVTYEVTGAMPDGHGVTRLKLNRIT